MKPEVKAKVKPSDQEKVEKIVEGKDRKVKNDDSKIKEVPENTKEPKTAAATEKMSSLAQGKRPLQTPPSTSTTASSCPDGKRARVDKPVTSSDKRGNSGPTGSSPEKKKLRFDSDLEARCGIYNYLDFSKGTMFIFYTIDTLYILTSYILNHSFPLPRVIHTSQYT